MEQNNQNSWKNIYLICLTIVTILCIIGGIVWHVGGSFRPHEDLKKTAEMTDVSLDKFKSVDTKLSMGDLSIVYGDSYMVSYNYPNKLQPEIEVKNGTLHVKQKVKGGLKLGFNDLGNLKDMDYDLVITVPKNEKLDTVSLSMDMGAISLSNIEINNLTVDADMGNIEINDTTLEKITVDADMGNIELRNVTCEKAEFDADMGNIEAQDSIFKSVFCDADMGSVEIRGEFEVVTAKCEMGSVSVETEQDLENVTMDLSADMGSVTVNGKNKGNDYKN